MTEPIPCPICGKQPRFTGFKTCVEYHGILHCSDNGHSVEILVTASTEQEAIAKATAAWNNRYHPPEIQQALD